ncbi:MAG: hypothetical protein HEQ22_01740 [Sphingopyxis sp.]|uniref:lipase secretion chaperone n=1 Tax=Sphingopyxis sp. TaxID=1908224 RepID=UPI003D81166F
MIARDGGSRPKGRALAIAAGGTLLIFGILTWRLVPGSGADTDEQGHLVTLADNGLSADAKARLAIPAAASAPLPASLAGTAVDGSFTLDGAGHFVPDKNALRLFEYFFSANGEESKDVLRGRILLHATGAGLSDRAVNEIAAVLDRYMAYRDAARATLASGGGSPADLGARVSQMRALQRATLGPDLAKAFYGDDAALADVDMRRLAILRDSTMTQGERQRAIAAIDAQVPQEVRDAREASAMPSALYQRVEAMRASGGSSEEIASLRRSEYGAGAADRLATLDQSRERWTQRMTAYRSEEQALRSAYGSPDSGAFRQAVETLRQRHFSAEELARVRALDAEGR